MKLFKRLHQAYILALFLLFTASESLAGDLALAINPDDPSLEWVSCPPFFHPDCRIAVLHGDPAQPNVDVLFEYPAGESFVEHWHTSPERIIMLKGAFELRYEGQDSATLKPGDYAWGPPNRKHSGTCVSEETCLIFVAFEGPVDAHEVGAAETE